MKRILVLLLAVTALSAACTSADGGDSSGSPSSPPTASATGSQPTGLGGGSGETSPPPSSPTNPTSPTTSPRSTPKATGPVRELAGPCPYITDEDAREAEGDRVGNVFRLSSTPVGCRFYFEYDANAIILQITFQRFSSTDAALNSLIALTRAHPEYVTDKDIGAGAVSVKADLQGTPTWQCRFVKGTYVVTVHTRQPDPSYNARRIARLIEPKVP